MYTHAHTHPLREWAVVGKGEDIEWYQQSVEQLVRQYRVEADNAKTEDVLDVVEMIQVLSH
jgi:hypothetical protein